MSLPYKVLFFSEVGIGVMNNTILLLSHILIFLLQHRPRPTDLTISHLALIHIVKLISVGFVVTGIFGSSPFWNDFTCKSILYLNKLMRGLSIGTTCLLSVLQSITLSPRSSFLAKYKQNSALKSLYCLFFLWVCNLCISARFLLSTGIDINRTSNYLHSVSGSCSVWPQNPFLLHVFTTLTTLQEVVFMGTMVLSSGYMVTLLCQHQRLSQYLHSTKLFIKAPPEQRAIQTIFLLMSFFVLMYFTDCVISSLTMAWNMDQTRLYVQILLSNGFSTISPLVLISTEKRILLLIKLTSV